MAERSLKPATGLGVILGGLLLAFFVWLLQNGFPPFVVVSVAPLVITGYTVTGAMLWLVFTDHGHPT